MVLNLEIQTSNKPGKEIASICKVCSCFQLVYGPAVFQFVLVAGIVEIRFAENMCRLENERQRQSTDKMHHQEAD